MLHQLLERWGLDKDLDEPIERVGAFALAMLLLDFFIAYGPFGGLSLRVFNQDEPGTPAARRFLSQLAAKVVGILFLAAVFPIAFHVLLDPELRDGAHFTDISHASQRMVEVASGYFVYDLIICLMKLNDNGFAFLIHAVVCFTVFTVAAFKGVLHYYGAAFLMWELSTPLMYARWLMLKAGWAHTDAFLYISIAFMAVFFACRNVWGPIMTLAFWRDSALQLASASPVLPPAAIWTIRVMCIALNLLNAYWFGQMVLIAVKGSRGQPKTKAS
ncbi:hypothetical protein D9Q98_004574 [Chlorella vulgaris]|uniref:TLC domain-containing protein n=1 Tax=Chlorella vulgaris TaxID=3077 RepID=A0A9D4YY24_CHLVU|nr:hypothetical protein D9Q98_004574 [Chlorella vulgaris]